MSTTDQLEKYSKLRTEKGHEYLRWLMLISTGAFSLTANLIFGQSTYAGCSLLVLKLALTANAIGILFGAIAVAGESILAKGVVRILCDKEIFKLQQNHEALANLPNAYILPPYMKLIENIFYISLCFSLCCWIVFIWLQ